MQYLDKQGNYAFVLLAVGVFIAAGIILTNLALNAPNIDWVGETAKNVLVSSEKQQNAFLQIDEDVEGAARDAAQTTARDDFIANETRCDAVGYTVIEDDCDLEPQRRFDEAMEDNLRAVTQDIPSTASNNFLDYTREGWSLDVTSQSGLLFTVDDVTEITTESSTEAGQTAWGEPLVKVNDITNVQCSGGRSCTGYKKQCAVKPAVYNKLESLAEDLDDLGIRVRVTSTTRTEEMQRFFHESQEFCQQRKQEIDACKGDLDSEQCNEQYASYLRNEGYDNRYACAPSGNCVPACDPIKNGELNDACTHMTGNAIDIQLIRENDDGDPTVINSKDSLKDPMRKTLCEHGFINFYDEVWHYEYKSPQWYQHKEDNAMHCAYGDEAPGRDWATVDSLEERLT